MFAMPRLDFIVLTAALSACSSTTGPGAENPSPDPGAGDNHGIPDRPTGCPDTDNPPGRVIEIRWPSADNVHFAQEGDTVRFVWDDGEPHNVLQVAAFEGQDPPLGPYADAGWSQQLRSGEKTLKGSFDWNTGVPHCGYRPGIYFFVDEDNPAGGVVSVALTTREDPSPHFAPRPCSELTDTTRFNGRYADFADRSRCTLFEVNNFTTVAHFDWVLPTFAARQGDLVLFRWTGLHNVVQVHNVHEDRLIPGGLASGPRTNCVGGPNGSCVNGPYHLGEFLIDTTNHRPGMIHLSDGCAYGCADCPWECRGPDTIPTGTNMQFLLARAERGRSPKGSCCAIDPSKGTACRVVELFNDAEGMQFEYNVPVHRGDLVRMRWSGRLQIVQTEPDADGSPSRRPRTGGLAMSEPVECVPGPDWSCLGGNTGDAELILDVDQAIRDGRAERSEHGQHFFTFQAFGENEDGFSSQDSGILLYVAEDAAYADNPPCP
ncbi:MAG TPA: hypothetical protein VK013_01460 [Myxococcaceae bacterium]|nr:hypothetical protein [Myxococcaceae bacterium]